MHQDLKVWQKAIELAKKVYLLLDQVPNNEKYGLINQIQRSVVSVPSNIAEGAARQYNKEYIHFLSIARGSLSELDTQIVLLIELYKIDATKTIELINEVNRLLNGLMKCLKTNNKEYK
ncbi:MAG: four helix bundle protein, partial [Chlorobi bacterium]|nr:four helix bundle protein [Chlorobiota bacterium]